MNISKTFAFQFAGFSGLDTLWSFFPKMTQTRVVARAWIKLLTINGGKLDPVKTPMYLKMPWGVFKLVDLKGNVQRHVGEI